MTLPTDPNVVHDLDIGQVAFFDSYIEILPNKMDSSVWYDDNNISAVLSIFQDRIGESLCQKVGGPIVDEDSDGEAFVTRQIEGVAYSLRCDSPETDDALKLRAQRVLDQRNVPSWVWAAYYKPGRIYVGGTYRPDARIREHLGQSYEYEGSVFTEIFQPTGIETIMLSLGESPYDLEQQEAEWWEDDPDFFVFQA